MNASLRKRNHAAWVGPLVALTGLVTYFTVAVRFPDLRDSAIVNLVLVIGGTAIAAWGLLRRRNWKSWIGFGAAAFLVEPDGTISWSSLTDNYRVRVRPEHVLEALKNTG